MNANIIMKNNSEIRIDNNGNKYVTVEEYSPYENSNSCLSAIIFNNYDINSDNTEEYSLVEKQIIEANKDIYNGERETVGGNGIENTILYTDEKIILPDMNKTKEPKKQETPKPEPTTQPETNNKNNTNEFDYSKDDGIISTKDKLINFGKGLISPITDMFKSPENFAIGAGIIAGSAALIYFTGGLAAPVLVAAGAGLGLTEFGINANNANNAKKDKDAINAWQGMGAGTSVAGLSVIGAKPALKATGASIDGLNSLTAVAICFKEIPNSIKNSISLLKTKKSNEIPHIEVDVPKRKVETIKNETIEKETKENIKSDKTVEKESSKVSEIKEEPLITIIPKNITLNAKPQNFVINEKGLDIETFTAPEGFSVKKTTYNDRTIYEYVDNDGYDIKKIECENGDGYFRYSNENEEGYQVYIDNKIVKDERKGVQGEITERYYDDRNTSSEKITYPDGKVILRRYNTRPDGTIETKNYENRELYSIETMESDGYTEIKYYKDNKQSHTKIIYEDGTIEEM